MIGFRFLKIPNTNRWVILDPGRSKRPNVGHQAERICPFCAGNEKMTDELLREGDGSHWSLRVVRNKYAFAKIHEIVIHSPDHHKNFEELPLGHIDLILRNYRSRFQENMKYGQVYIFHNRGIGAGESLPHPHTQLAVVPNDVHIDAPPLDLEIYKGLNHESGMMNLESGVMTSFVRIFRGENKRKNDDGRFDFIRTGNFMIFCPISSQWPDEVWIAPMRKGKFFGQIEDEEIRDLGFCLQRLIAIFDIRHGHEFPFNFYIYPGKNWYLRIIPRNKILGGFEAGTGIIVNTQDPSETFAFIKEHFFEPDLRKIRMMQQADYWRSV
jgi:UDPglucose--hexose-1-phosphate uridylyltransferase